jgi:putative copper export protein
MLFPLIILPAINGIDEENRKIFLNNFTKRFTPYFAISGIVVGITGWYQSVQMEDDLNLPVLIAKHIAILPLIVVSIYYWLYLTPRISKTETSDKKLWNQIIILGWVQCILGIIVLLLTGWLTS